MTRFRKPSPQTIAVLEVLLMNSASWMYGLEIAKLTKLKSGTLYPILIRCAERGFLDAKWVDPLETGRPPRHAYKIRPEGVRFLELNRNSGSDRQMIESAT